MAGGPAFNTQINSDTSNTTRSHNTTTTNTTTTNTTTTNATFDLSINSNTIIVKGLQARNLEARLNDKLAASGRTVTPGDLYAVTVRRGKYQDGVPYQAGQKIQPAGDGSVTHILEAFGVSAGGETINFKRVTDEVLRKMERGAVEGENVAEVAGDGEGDGEYSSNLKERSKQAILAQNRLRGKEYEISKFAEFSEKYPQAQQQVTIKTDGGIKMRLDAIGLDAEGVAVINEFKSSETAPLTPNQKSGIPDIINRGGNVIGKGKGIFVNGYRIPQGTKINIDRPSNRRKE